MVTRTAAGLRAALGRKISLAEKESNKQVEQQ